MDSVRAQVARLRSVALAALREFPVPDGRLTFVDHGENTTFRHDGPGGSHLVRVHRPLRYGRDADAHAAIWSELTWLVAIRADTSLAVPQPVTALDGHVVVAASARGESRDVSVLRWMPGRIVARSARPVHLRRLGAAMAGLHVHADSWRPPAGFTRIAWDHDAFFGNVMVYGGLPAAEVWDLLPRALRGRFHAVGDRMASVMASDSDHGLIHADLHLGNAVFSGDRVQFIDFDDCGFGPRLYDLAVALWELRDTAAYPELRAALLAGYQGVRDVDVTRLDDYIAVRQVAFDLWFTGSARLNPQFAARLDEVHKWSASMLDLVERR